MTPAELRELADRAEAAAVREVTIGASYGSQLFAPEVVDQANRLFLMARNLRERAVEVSKAARERGEI